MRLRNGLFLLVIQPFGDSRDWKIVPTDNQRKRKKAVALTVSLVDLVWGISIALTMGFTIAFAIRSVDRSLDPTFQKTIATTGGLK